MSDLVRRLKNQHVRDDEGCVTCDALDSIDALESRCADKNIDIAQLIEQLEKAEAHIAELERTAIPLNAFRVSPYRTLGETK